MQSLNLLAHSNEKKNGQGTDAKAHICRTIRIVNITEYLSIRINVDWNDFFVDTHN